MHASDIKEPTAISPVWDVDCHENPLDIRPVVGAILTTGNWLLNRLPGNKRLVILIAENHLAQTHKPVQQGLLGELKKRKDQGGHDFAFGFESDHTVFKSLQDAATRSGFSVSTLPASVQHHAPVMSLIAFCHKQGVSMRFNDAAFAEKEIPGYPSNSYTVYDQNDPFTYGLIKKHMPKLIGQDVYRGVRPGGKDPSIGLVLSNLAMIEQAIHEMKCRNIRLFVQTCGGAHALGSNFSNLQFKDSLVAQFRKNGCEVLPVILNFDNAYEDMLSAAGRSNLKTSVKIRGLEPGLMPLSHERANTPFTPYAEWQKRISENSPGLLL